MTIITFCILFKLSSIKQSYFITDSKNLHLGRTDFQVYPLPGTPPEPAPPDYTGIGINNNSQMIASNSSLDEITCKTKHFFKIFKLSSWFSLKKQIILIYFFFFALQILKFKLVFYNYNYKMCMLCRHTFSFFLIP